MEWNRSRFFMIGAALLMLGTHFRMVESIVLTKQATQFLAEKMGDGQLASNGSGLGSIFGARAAIGNKEIRPPEWLGWSLLSVGSVITLHSVVMRRNP